MEALASGTPLGAFHRLDRLVGSGAMGEVWTVLRQGQEQPRAAKILRPEHGQDTKLVERFITERSILLSLKHPGIVPVLDLVVDGDRLAIIMEYEAGGSLREVLGGRRTLAAVEALTICIEVLDALDYAHSLGVTHRDIKPDNILLSAVPGPSLESLVKVTDFGVASLQDAKDRRTTGIVGTPYYLSPESITTGNTGPATDVYATGIMLYELLAGRTPFDGPGTDFAIAYRHISSRPPRLDIPQPFWEALESLLAKEPSARPTASEAAGVLRRLAKKYRDLPALKPLPAPVDFEEAERPATAVRGIAPNPEGVAEAGSRDEAPGPGSDGTDTGEIEPLPELGEASRQTLIRPLKRPVIQEPAAGEDSVSKRPKWMTNQVLWFSGGTLTIVLVVVAFLIWGPSMNAGAQEPFSIQGEAQPALPTGLGVQRSADYQPSQTTARLVITYSAQKAELSGDFLEVLPNPEGISGCPNVTWEGATGTRNQPSVNGLDVQCGWEVSGVKVPAGGSVQVTANVAVDLKDKDELSKWVGQVEEKTHSAISDSQVRSTAYPVQRITNVQVHAPDRAVSRTTLPVTVLPVWPSGSDPLNPLFSSPGGGEPSSMLEAISSTKTPVRFVDGCSGSTVVSKDGQTVTAVSVAPSCTVNADVGNFVNVESNQFSIVARK